MPNWKELHKEILCEIFKELRSNFSRQDLVECQLVCKNWQKYASLIFYREISFREHLQMEKFIKCMQNNNLRNLVQEIAFWYDKYDKCQHDERTISLFYELAETCPNVQIFKGTLRTSHWDALGRAVGSYWKQLKQLPEPEWSIYSHQNTFTNYYTLASVCHSTLTHVTLPPIPPSWPEFKRVLPLLPFFINLTHLTVNSDYIGSTLMDYDEVIQQCPNLMCFTLNSNKKIIERAHDYTKYYNVLSMRPHLKLKKLVVERDLHQDIIDYIMHKFPNLECCNVHLSVNDDLLHCVRPWIRSCYEEKLRRFQEYLSSRRCDWFFTHVSFPLIEEYLQRTTNPIVRISSTEKHSPWLHMQQDNMFWIIRNTAMNTDRLKELFKKYQNGIKVAYLDMSYGFGEKHLIEDIFRECRGLEKFTYKKIGMDYSKTNFPVANQTLSPSLTTLKLIAKFITSEVLSAYSCALPELRNVTIETTYRFGNPPSFVVDMPKTKFNHLKLYLDIGLAMIKKLNGSIKEALDKPVLLEISQDSDQKQFLANTTLLNQVEEFVMAANKGYGYSIVIKCTSIDFISISFNEMHILKEYPLSLKVNMS
ncbi:uncharacterized protein RHIMIDRAFT_269221 [Rhizopus microsporus ATCC 52813]|uniref:Uncharacterized protein n=1 Tax=Rhizopus microsporus ATCC 52813 TaxID=1340429 RepID=A0A2G4SI17_RHIZD|nr:uncharacterized protein RHIMIDRAFT_269221 [Rhizopus microsporus ATCC 52813]PHZ08389.1 hypothetical protein RHIMIDRAFT_269221 [Rhizopus microsporus ATCC 52813]